MLKFKPIFIKVHLISLSILLINFLIHTIFEISLASSLRLVVKILFYISGGILFFYYIKPFKKRVLYFSIYVFSPVFIFFSWLTDGLMGALLSSFFIFFFNPGDVRFENDQIQIKTKFEGLLGACCKYEVIEKKYFLFERKAADFKFEESLNIKKNEVKIQNDVLQIHLQLKEYDQEKEDYITKDTTLNIHLKKNEI